jgi:hypothetical protein
MRRAYIGVSSPIAYDRSREFSIGYKNKEFVIPIGLSAIYNGLPYPTPIFESAYGMALFFDELWFLSRALCPPNMQHLPFVHFVTESTYISEIQDKYRDANKTLKIFENDPSDYFSLIKDCTDAKQIKEELQLPWDAQLTDRSEIFGWGGQLIFGSIGKFEHVQVDLDLMSYLSIPNLELVTNRFSTPIIEKLTGKSQRNTDAANTAELLLFDSIPNYLSRDGSFHPSINEARNDPFITDFRKWVTDSRQLSIKELADLARETQVAITSLYAKLIRNHFGDGELRSSLASAIVGAGAELLLPGITSGVALTSSLINERKRRKIRYQGFLMSQRERARLRS